VIQKWNSPQMNFLSFIFAIYPPAESGQPLAPVYMILQLVRRTARDVAITAGGLLPHLLTLVRSNFCEGEPSQSTADGFFLLRFCTLAVTFLSKVRCPVLSGLSFLRLKSKNDKTACCIFNTIRKK
jgi:hypothetical protein